jgi:hypothetical protein
MNSFLPFDWVQCSWLGTERVVTAFMASPVIMLATGSPGRAPAVYRGPGRGKGGGRSLSRRRRRLYGRASFALLER